MFLDLDVDFGHILFRVTSLFRESFDEFTETVEINEVQVLKLTLIMNVKCRSILGREGEDKKTSDAQDIKFLFH